MSDLQALLQAVDASAPCGEDLTYDADFLALETAAAGKPEQQFGDTVIAAEPPDWRDIERRCRALLARTKDLRVAGLLGRAWVGVKGLRGLADALELVAALLEAHWDEVHPRLEDGDAFMRVNALGMLDDTGGLLADLRGSELLRAPGGGVAVRDALALLRGQTLEQQPSFTAAQLRLAAADAWQQGQPGLQALAAARASLQRIVAACSAHLQGSDMPPFENIAPMLELLAQLEPRAGGAATPDAAEADASATSAGSAAAAAPGAAMATAAAPGELRHREDARRQLIAVAEFLERTEPTNPAPLLVRRAARLMGLGFLDILRELAPDSLGTVQNITGEPGGDA
jgi:type VI secretion system protein ImpA